MTSYTGNVTELANFLYQINHREGTENLATIRCKLREVSRKKKKAKVPSPPPIICGFNVSDPFWPVNFSRLLRIYTQVSLNAPDGTSDISLLQCDHLVARGGLYWPDLLVICIDLTPCVTIGDLTCPQYDHPGARGDQY